MQKKNKRLSRRLIKLALLTSPLIATINIFPFILIAETTTISRMKDANFIIGVMLFCVFILVVWFWNIFLLTTIIQKGKKIFKALHISLSYLGVIALVLLVKVIKPMESPVDGTYLVFVPIFSILIGNSIILILINLLVQQENYSTLKLKNSEMELNNIKTKHEQLKQQIHPHFLFNCLANLRALITQKDDRALEYTDQLSVFLRKSLNYSESNLVSVQDELHFMETYLKLQLTRFSTSLQYSIQIDPTVLIQKIPIFTLQTLAENAIKHNAFTKAEPLKIKVFSSENSHEIFIQNNKIKSFVDVKEDSGLGLKNLKERFILENLTPPSISNSPELFTVKISLK